MNLSLKEFVQQMCRSQWNEDKSPWFYLSISINVPVLFLEVSLSCKRGAASEFPSLSAAVNTDFRLFFLNIFQGIEVVKLPISSN